MRLDNSSWKCRDGTVIDFYKLNPLNKFDLLHKISMEYPNIELEEFEEIVVSIVFNIK